MYSFCSLNMCYSRAPSQRYGLDEYQIPIAVTVSVTPHLKFEENVCAIKRKEI